MPKSLTVALISLQLVMLATEARGLHADERFDKTVRPFVQMYCAECHNSKKPRADLNLTRYQNSQEITHDFRTWSHVVEFIRHGEMPPEDARQPSPDEIKRVLNFIEDILLEEAKKHAGDPGVILPRRLSNTEFDLSIRDLTGIHMRPTRNFPPDPAGGEGFDNTGEALTMSPSRLKKYLQAAQHVADHLVLKPSGIEFAPFPVTSYNERKTFTEQAIINFYKAHEVRLIHYLEAAWRYRHRETADRNVSIDDWARRANLSGKYLSLVWQTLEGRGAGLQPANNNGGKTAGYKPAPRVGFLKELGDRWQALPAPRNAQGVSPELESLRDFIVFGQANLFDRDQQLIRSSAGNWPISHLDFRANVAAARDRYQPDNLGARRYQIGTNRWRSEHLTFDRLPQPSKNRPTPDMTLTFHAQPAFASASNNYVLLHRPAFSKGGRLPKYWGHEELITSDSDRKRYAEDSKKNEVITLRSFLEKHLPDVARKLQFGRHPNGQKIHRDSIAVEAPATIEIPLTEATIRTLGDRQLAIPCELDPAHADNAAVFVWRSSYETEKPPLQNQSVPQPARDNDRKWKHGCKLLIDPQGKLAKRLEPSHAEFCNAFPNGFFYVDDRRGLAAGFHLVEGFYRDDRPLVEKVLDEREKAELDQLWEELQFVTNSTETLLRGFVWFERSERHVLQDERFDFLRAEDPRLVEEEMLARFERVYLQKNGVKLAEGGIKPLEPNTKFDMIHGFFEQIRAGLKRQQQLIKTAEAAGLAEMEALMRRAYRRPLAARDTQSIRRLYDELRKQGQDVEQSLRGVLVAVLMSPDFCFRYREASPGKGVQPLSDTALASRLSYFLWSSLPDGRLLAVAEAGKLQNESELIAQTRRMLNDDRVEAFAREFFGQWLRYRDFLSKDPINATAFPGYTDELKQAMAEEPVRLATWLIQNDRPITDLLNSDTTFVNEVLAKHYGGEIASRYRTRPTDGSANPRISPASHPRVRAAIRGISNRELVARDDWHRVENIRAEGRGGLFGMAVVLTQNSSGERTSPVKRGFWTVHHLLGQHFPPPPADVPELPASEKGAKKTIRELLAEHAANRQCAMCHQHFDGLGLALEGFDPIGRVRNKDLAGRQIDDVARLPNGKSAQGVQGLIEYVEQHRRDDFVRTLCRKFLGYALGRSVLLSDQPLLLEMEQALAENDYRFSVLFETVIKSPQFRKQRGRDFVVHAASVPD